MMTAKRNNNNHNNNNNNKNLPAIKAETLTPELLEQFFQNQAKEIELRQNELNLKKQEDDHSFAFANTALQVKGADRNADREHDRESQKVRLIFSWGVIIVIAGIIVYALSLGKENFAMEIIKAIIFILSGGAGGFAIGKSSHGSNRQGQKSPKRENVD